MKLAFELGVKEEFTLFLGVVEAAGLLKILFAFIENVRRFFSCLSPSSSCAAGCSATLAKDC
jgi:hypothetical protein